MTKTEARVLADAAIAVHWDSACYYASQGTGDWFCVDESGRAEFSVGKPKRSFLMAVPLDELTMRNKTALRKALLGTARI